MSQRDECVMQMSSPVVFGDGTEVEFRGSVEDTALHALQRIDDDGRTQTRLRTGCYPSRKCDAPYRNVLLRHRAQNHADLWVADHLHLRTGFKLNSLQDS